MVKQLIWVIAVFSIVSLGSVPLFIQAMPTVRFRNLMTITGKDIRVLEMVVVKHNREGIDEAVLTYPTLNECTSYQRVQQVEVDAVDCRNKGSRIAFTQRKLRSEFHSKRWIPGGPDAQHHEIKGK